MISRTSWAHRQLAAMRPAHTSASAREATSRMEKPPTTALVSGTVPSTIAQTSVAAEWCAAAVVAQLATGAVDAAQDCKAVVDEWSKPLAVRLRPSSVHAGQSKILCAHPSSARVALRWVKGHVNEEAAVGAQAKRDARGNDLGDKEADLAMARHPQPPDWLRGWVALEVKDAQAVILHGGLAPFVLPAEPGAPPSPGTCCSLAWGAAAGRRRALPRWYVSARGGFQSAGT